jgi:nucleotide-binding universal stress UspA family protein
MHIDKLLVPIDFSPTSEAALRYAVDLAEAVGHTVVMLHAIGPMAYPVMDGAIISPPSQAAEQITSATRMLKRLEERFDRTGVAFESKVVQGGAAEEILRCAREESCGLIVMGTHGRSGWKRIALGSVAEHVMRHASIPVLTVRSEPPETPSMLESPPLV